MQITDLDLYCDTGKTCRKPALPDVSTVPALLVIITVTSHTGGFSLSNAALRTLGYIVVYCYVCIALSCCLLYSILMFFVCCKFCDF